MKTTPKNQSLYIGSDDSDGDGEKLRIPHRRSSFSEDLGRPRRFLVDIKKTKDQILRHEDTDGDERVTIEDRGPKHVHLPSYTHGSSGYFRHSIRGNYMVSNLLQELALLEKPDPQTGPSYPLPSRGHAVITEDQLSENPVVRLNRMIRMYFWPALVRRIDADGLTIICMDPKNRGGNKQPRVYVPHDDEFALKYFQEVAESRRYLDLDVVKLPREITPEFVKSINERPGILSLDLERKYQPDGTFVVEGKPFVVPGGRFNELYGWDSYFIILGLLEDECNTHTIHLAKSIIDNFVYEIEHYAMVLNANRSYYLRRSQPPFLTDMALQVYDRLVALSGDGHDAMSIKGILGDMTPLDWLTKTMVSAIKEYENVWMIEPRLVRSIGLSRYCSDVEGIPPETESTHFDILLKPYTERHGLTKQGFIDAYNSRQIKEPELDEYFKHDRAVRESGHDTTYRLDEKAAHLLTIDLCALLYKYETDIAKFIETSHGGLLKMPDGSVQTSAKWREAANQRKSLADTYLWNRDTGMYFDYDFVRGEQSNYESVTCLWSMWAEMCSVEQAATLVKMALPRFEEAGGLVCGTNASRGDLSLKKPTRQWDYPYGWAPHQILAWKGLCKYGYYKDVRRLAYRWLYMITRAFSDFNGVVPEKFDVVKMSHKVNAEYGNVGTDFRIVPREGFGWMNASYLIGQRYLNLLERRALGALVHPDSLLKTVNYDDKQ